MQHTQIVGLACTPPAKAGRAWVRWSVRALHDEIERRQIATLHPSTVHHILTDADLHPHQVRYWRHALAEDFEAKAASVLWYYERVTALADRGELVVCLDEKPNIQALGRAIPDLPPAPGYALRRDWEYVRYGTVNLLVIYNLLTGQLWGRVLERNDAAHFLPALEGYLAELPWEIRCVHCILDQGASHIAKTTREWIAAQEGLVRFHFTPAHASWLNQAELALSAFSRRYVCDRVSESRQEAITHIYRSLREVQPAARTSISVVIHKTCHARMVLYPNLGDGALGLPLGMGRSVMKHLALALRQPTEGNASSQENPAWRIQPGVEEGSAMPTRREVLRSVAGVAATLAAGRLLAPYLSGPARFVREALAGPAPLPPPETATIRLGVFPCDAPVMAAEPFLQQEGFTQIEIVPGGRLAAGRPDIEIDLMFPPAIAGVLQEGQRIVALAGLHPGCVEIWAQPEIRSLQDLRGQRIVVTERTLANLRYSYVAIVLKHAGVDPAQVNFVVQPDANPVALFLQGRNDALFAATIGTAALHANPDNRGRVIHNQLMDLPWSRLACCILVARQEWYSANPIAAKRAVRAVLRAADAQTPSRADAVRRVTDRGFFGGPANFDNVLYAASMVPANWRDLDLERSVRFYGQLLVDVGLVKVTVEDMVRTIDLTILNELKAELRRA